VVAIKLGFDVETQSIVAGEEINLLTVVMIRIVERDTDVQGWDFSSIAGCPD
jgi:hypothetical protein